MEKNAAQPIGIVFSKISLKSNAWSKLSVVIINYRMWTSFLVIQ